MSVETRETSAPTRFAGLHKSHYPQYVIHEQEELSAEQNDNLKDKEEVDSNVDDNLNYNNMTKDREQGATATSSQ